MDRLDNQDTLTSLVQTDISLKCLIKTLQYGLTEVAEISLLAEQLHLERIRSQIKLFLLDGCSCAP